MPGTGRRSVRGLGRVVLRGVLATVLLVQVLIAVGYPLYLHPTVDRPAQVDAIVVLGGPGDQRYRTGLELARDGYADQLVLSDPGGLPDTTVGRMCAHGRAGGATVWCFTPDPATTRGEARAVRDMARLHGWRSILVVTHTAHISRARHIFQRCVDGPVVMVAAPGQDGVGDLIWAYGYQSGAYLKAFVESGC